MVPRAKIVSLDVEAAPEDVLRVLRETPHARYPVHEGDVEGGVAGLITIEDIAEDLFGEILEEHETPQPSVWQEGEGAADEPDERGR